MNNNIQRRRSNVGLMTSSLVQEFVGMDFPCPRSSAQLSDWHMCTILLTGSAKESETRHLIRMEVKAKGLSQLNCSLATPPATLCVRGKNLTTVCT